MITEELPLEEIRNVNAGLRVGCRRLMGMMYFFALYEHVDGLRMLRQALASSYRIILDQLLLLLLGKWSLVWKYRGES